MLRNRDSSKAVMPRGSGFRRFVVLIEEAEALAPASRGTQSRCRLQLRDVATRVGGVDGENSFLHQVAAAFLEHLVDAARSSWP